MARLLLGLGGVGLGALLIAVSAIVGWVVVPNIIDDKITDETQLVNGSETWEKWEKVDFPMQLRFHFFNITNPEDFGTGRVKLVERGPYVYDMTRTKVDIEVDEKNDTIRYREIKSYYFNRNDSIGSEEDMINVPNVPLISVAHVATVKYPPGDATLSSAQGIVFVLINSEGLVKTASVREILFDGWKLNGLYSFIPDAPPDFAGGTFGFYKGKNGSDDGVYEINAGRKDYSKFGKIVSWNDEEELKWWYTEGLEHDSKDHFCNKINGSDGSIYPPFIEKDTILRIFNSEVCRSLYLKFDSETEFQGIPAYKFTAPEEMFAHPDENEDNRCFCTKQSDRVAHQCLQSLIRINGCHGGAPIVTSNPHFLYGNDELFAPIEIESPNRDKHGTFIVVEPNSGMLMQASKKVQIGIELQNLNGFRFFKDLDFSNLTNSESIFYPVIWAEEFVELDEESVEDFYNKLIKPQEIVNVVRWVLIGVGGLGVLVGLFFLIKK